MPIYEYVCAACGAAFERYQSTRDAPAACPRCGSPAAEKQLSTFAMAGAGSGAPRGGCGCGRGGCGCHH